MTSVSRLHAEGHKTYKWHSQADQKERHRSKHRTWHLPVSSLRSASLRVRAGVLPQRSPLLRTTPDNAHSHFTLLAFMI